MAEAGETKAAVYDAIIEVLKNAEHYNGTMKSAMVRDAAVAFRAASGGPQPGNVVVEK